MICAIHVAGYGNLPFFVEIGSTLTSCSRLDAIKLPLELAHKTRKANKMGSANYQESTLLFEQLRMKKREVDQAHKFDCLAEGYSYWVLDASPGFIYTFSTPTDNGTCLV